MGIIFLDGRDKVTEDEKTEIGRINEEYFQTSKDKEQAEISRERLEWIVKSFPEGVGIIKTDKIIGSTLVLPCTLELMNSFLKNKINEEELFKGMEEYSSYDKMEAIYLCSAILLPEYRGKGLASQSWKMSIRKMMEKSDKKSVLFYWEYSNEGKFLSERVARDLGLELRRKM